MIRDEDGMMTGCAYVDISGGSPDSYIEGAGKLINERGIELMKLGVVDPKFKELIIEQLGVVLEERDEIIAAYLFGSAAEAGPVVNDIDILILLNESDTNGILLLLCDLDVQIAEHLGFSTDQIDLVPFDLRLVEPTVLYDALETGILLKNSNDQALTDAIENLSRYFLENERILNRQKILRREMYA